MKKGLGNYYTTDQDKDSVKLTLEDLHGCHHILPLVKDKDICIQAGGHVGIFPLFYAKYFREVYTFEPYEPNFEALAENTKEAENIHLSMNALFHRSNREGFLAIPDSSNSGTARISNAGQEITTIALDDIEFNGKVGLIHLDIEGSEYFALAGAEKLISKDKPIIVLENRGHKVGWKSDADCIALLTKFGYVITKRVLNDLVFRPLADNELIPKTIHQIWLGQKPIAERFLKYTETWKKYFPNWEYKLWRDADVAELIAESGLGTFGTDSHNVGACSDIVRYLILKKYGGLYVDTDFECLKPFEQLLTPGCFHYGDAWPGRPSNALIATPPEHKITNLVLDQFKHGLPISISPGIAPTVAATGPECLGRALKYWLGNSQQIMSIKNKDFQVGSLYPGNVVCFNMPSLYPYHFEDTSVSWQTFTVEEFPNALAAHHWGMEWLNSTYKKSSILKVS
jgi:FkbM family methyltransferase